MVNFFIIPLFALANTAILIPGDMIGSLGSSIAMGVIVGLVVGKPVGIFLFSRILVALRVAKLPQNVTWPQILCMGTLAGIGFTMSIFTTGLAFEAEASRDIAKIAILFSMVISVMVSWLNFVISERKLVKVAQAIQPATKGSPDIAIG